jgi:hypothetical protein
MKREQKKLDERYACRAWCLSVLEEGKKAFSLFWAGVLHVGCQMLICPREGFQWNKAAVTSWIRQAATMPNRVWFRFEAKKQNKKPQRGEDSCEKRRSGHIHAREAAPLPYCRKTGYKAILHHNTNTTHTPADITRPLSQRDKRKSEKNACVNKLAFTRLPRNGCPRRPRRRVSAELDSSFCKVARETGVGRI